LVLNGDGPSTWLRTVGRVAPHVITGSLTKDENCDDHFIAVSVCMCLERAVRGEVCACVTLERARGAW